MIEPKNLAGDRQLTWPGQPKCRFCRTPLTRLQSGVGLCDSDICATRHRNESHRLRYRLRWNDYVETQHAGIAAHGAEIVAGARVLDVPVAELDVGVVPWIDRPMARVPAFRREAFLAYLREITAQAFEQPEPGPLPDHRTRNEAPEPERADAACIACRGHCCVLGMAANAFLRVETINHVRGHHPELGPDEIVAHYEARIPDRAVRESCVFHGPSGCMLERRWRADMCNNFQCNGKRQALERAPDAQAMLWIATEDGVGRAMVHDQAGTRPVTPDADAGDTDPDRVAAAIAAICAKLPAKLPDVAPVYDTACRRCGSPINAERAAVSDLCGSACCDLAGRHDGL